jgi:hypothetical protein
MRFGLTGRTELCQLTAAAQPPGSQVHAAATDNNPLVGDVSIQANMHSPRDAGRYFSQFGLANETSPATLRCP